MVVSMKGHHNHDNNIIKEDIQPIVLEKVGKAAKNANSSLKFVFQDITNSVLSDDNAKDGLAFLQKSRGKGNMSLCPPLSSSMEDFEDPQVHENTK